MTAQSHADSSEVKGATLRPVTGSLERFLHYIDITNEKIGQGIRFLLLPLAGVAVTEVILRYFFNSPTIWAWDINLQLAGIIILLSAGYTLLHGRHVSIEAVTEHLSPKGKLYLELLAMIMVIFVAVILVWQGAEAGWESFTSRERLNSIWGPPIFQIKMLFPIAGALLLFQALAKFIRDLLTLLKTGAKDVN